MSKHDEKDPSGLDQHAPGAKLDAGKPRIGLVMGGFARALEQVSHVGTFGAQKYSPNGWRHVENGRERYEDALMRHYLASKRESHDDQTGLLHIAHMAWNALAVLELALVELEKVEASDRSSIPSIKTSDVLRKAHQDILTAAAREWSQHSAASYDAVRDAHAKMFGGVQWPANFMNSAIQEGKPTCPINVIKTDFPTIDEQKATGQDIPESVKDRMAHVFDESMRGSPLLTQPGCANAADKPADQAIHEFLKAGNQPFPTLPPAKTVELQAFDQNLHSFFEDTTQ